MLGQAFEYDGNSLPYTAAERRANDWGVELVKWDFVETRNSQVLRQDFHGVISNPTFANGRLITINGKIVGFDKATKGAARNVVDGIFNIPSFPNETNEFKRFDFTDDDSIEKFIRAKVFTKPNYENDIGNPVIDFTTELFAEDPLLRSKDINSATADYGLYGGVNLPINLPDDLNSAINSFQVVNVGNFASPTIITVSDEITNPKIINLTSGRFFKVNTTMSADDVLIIDADALTVELNGVNVLSDRAAGSNWLFARSGTNYFVLVGDDFDFDDQTKAGIEVEWFDAWL